MIFGDHVLMVEASIGVAVRDDPAASGEILLQQADTALYAAKRAGRGRFLFYTAVLDTKAREAELRQAVATTSWSCTSSRWSSWRPAAAWSLEALVRWNHPARGLLMPGDFIELAEETGAVVPLGAWVLRAACRQARLARRDAGAERAAEGEPVPQAGGAARPGADRRRPSWPRPASRPDG